MREGFARSSGLTTNSRSICAWWSWRRWQAALLVPEAIVLFRSHVLSLGQHSFVYPSIIKVGCVNESAKAGSQLDFDRLLRETMMTSSLRVLESVWGNLCARCVKLFLLGESTDFLDFPESQLSFPHVSLLLMIISPKDHGLGKIFSIIFSELPQEGFRLLIRTKSFFCSAFALVVSWQVTRTELVGWRAWRRPQEQY